MEEQNKYQIQSKSYQVQSSKTFKKVLNILPGPNESFILLVISNAGKQIFINMDVQGKILSEHNFQTRVNEIAMISKSQVMILEPRENKIKIFNFDANNKQIDIPFNFINEESDQSTIFTFKNNRCICICQKGNYNDNRLKLNYLSTPLTSQSKPIEVYETDQQWTYEYLIKKGNQRSMVLWYKQRNDVQFQIKTYEVKDGKGSYKQHKIKNQIGLAYNYTKQVQTAINNVWQMKEDIFCLACHTQKTQLNLKNKDGIVNNNFVWNVNTNEMRQSLFYFDQKYNDFVIDVVNVGDYCVFRTFYMGGNNKMEKSPCYFVKNCSEKIVAVQEWECSYRIKHEYPCFDDIIVDNQYENGEVSGFKMTILRLCQKK